MFLAGQDVAIACKGTAEIGGSEGWYYYQEGDCKEEEEVSWSRIPLERDQRFLRDCEPSNSSNRVATPSIKRGNQPQSSVAKNRRGCCGAQHLEHFEFHRPAANIFHDADRVGQTSRLVQDSYVEGRGGYCVRLLASEIAPEWLKVVKMGKVEALVVDRDERPTELDIKGTGKACCLNILEGMMRSDCLGYHGLSTGCVIEIKRDWMHGCIETCIRETSRHRAHELINRRFPSFFLFLVFDFYDQ